MNIKSEIFVIFVALVSLWGVYCVGWLKPWTWLLWGTVILFAIFLIVLVLL